MLETLLALALLGAAAPQEGEEPAPPLHVHDEPEGSLVPS